MVWNDSRQPNIIQAKRLTSKCYHTSFSLKRSTPLGKRGKTSGLAFVAMKIIPSLAGCITREKKETW